MTYEDKYFVGHKKTENPFDKCFRFLCSYELIWCGRRDLNPHGLRPPPPQDKVQNTD